MSRSVLVALIVLSAVSPARAGNVFVTGHDPDFHALDSLPAARLLEVALEFVSCDTTYTTTEKFLVVSARPGDLGGVPPGHRDPIPAGFSGLGLVEGVHFDVVNGAELAAVDFLDYTALAVVSSFGGLLTRAELDALNARAADVVAFLEAGGGVFASSECDATTGIACGAQLLAPAPAPMYQFLPFPLMPIRSQAPFTVTPEGAALGLVDADVNDATHNSFQDDAGLDVIDVDANGVPTTLSGRWTAAQVAPQFELVEVRDVSDCSIGLLLTWEEAIWDDPAFPGSYNVYRSAGPGASCADALTRAPVASALTELTWFDRTTDPEEEYVYVVEAEDQITAHGCDPLGPAGGAVTRLCTEPSIVDAALFPDPDGVYTTLFATHVADVVTLSWPDARVLLDRESFRLFKSPGTPWGPFALINGYGSIVRSHQDEDLDAAVQYFDLRVANGCELLSADEYPEEP